MILDGYFHWYWGLSSKPSAEFVSEEEGIEQDPWFEFDHGSEALLSIDTLSSQKPVIQNGASIINDISAGNLEKGCLKLLPNIEVPYIMMHMVHHKRCRVWLWWYCQRNVILFSEKIKRTGV
jgi:dihydropteroate synthase